jgi:hypothetical protein
MPRWLINLALFLALVALNPTQLLISQDAAEQTYLQLTTAALAHIPDGIGDRGLPNCPPRKMGCFRIRNALLAIGE